jgi:hypothetical protein
VAAGSRQVLAAEDQRLRNAEAPYPALVNLGRDTEGGLVLVDLEHVGAVQLTGERRRQMLRTLAAELAVSELADDLELALVGALVAPSLERLGIADRIKRYDGIAEAAPVLAAQHREQQAAIAAIGARHLRQARLSDHLDGAWEPLIIMADGAFTADQRADAALTDLLEMVSAGPRAAAAVVTSGTPLDDDAPREGVWVVCTDPGATVVVPGTDVSVTLEPLTDEDYADLVDIAATSLSTHDLPAVPPPPMRLPQAHRTLEDEGAPAAERDEGREHHPMLVAPGHRGAGDLPTVRRRTHQRPRSSRDPA